MNAIHQISLKLQLGIDPAAEVKPSALRAMWQARVGDRFDSRAPKPPRDAAGRRIPAPPAPTP